MSASSRPTSYTTIAADPATVRRKTVTRIDIEHAIDAREEARVRHVRACRRGNYGPADRDAARGAYVAACTTLLDRWEDQLRGWGLR
jgi:hypothetical protein